MLIIYRIKFIIISFKGKEFQGLVSEHCDFYLAETNF